MDSQIVAYGKREEEKRAHTHTHDTIGMHKHREKPRQQHDDEMVKVTTAHSWFLYITMILLKEGRLYRVLRP